MLKLVAPAALFATLLACGPSPVGDWEGTVEFSTEGGATYVNELSVDKDGTAEMTLYFLGEDPDDPSQMLIYYADFTADWELEDDMAGFICYNVGSDWISDMDCDFTDPGMSCDMSPDFYDDDATMLQWVEVEEE